MTASVVPDSAEQLRRWVEQTQFGTLRPLVVGAAVDQDAAGQTAVFFDVTLPPPDLPAGTWPIEEVLGLHEAVDAEAKRLELDLPWYVRLIPASEDEDNPNEADEE